MSLDPPVLLVVIIALVLIVIGIPMAARALPPAAALGRHWSGFGGPGAASTDALTSSAGPSLSHPGPASVHSAASSSAGSSAARPP
jgi:hypothetical protein